MRRLLRLAVASIALTVVITQCGAQLVSVVRPFTPGEVSGEARAQLHALKASLTDEDAKRARVFPEGELFLWEFYALALENVAETTGNPADRAEMAAEVRRVLPKMEATLAHRPFAPMKDWAVKGGICWFAGVNLVRARLVQFAPSPTKDEVERFHRDSATLARAFMESDDGVLVAYPQMSWPVDSTFALQSLQVHDALYGTDYFAPAYAKWKRTVTRAADPKTGLMPSFVYLDGHRRDGPRGCALSWSLAVLPSLDPAFAAEQWALYKKHLGRCRFGLCLFREYPEGESRAPDSDSGLIVSGYGMSATAFALAAARANGDTDTAASLQRVGELFGLPTRTLSGKRYAFGAVPIFDVFSVWVKTQPTPKGMATPSPFSLPALLLSVVFFAAAFWLSRVTFRAATALRAPRPASPPESAPAAPPRPASPSPSAAPRA